MQAKSPILLTIDVEECDIPLEYGISIELDEQLRISKEGLDRFMALVDALEIPVTIFCTAVFAQNHPEWIKNIHPRHELASHGFYHGKFDAKTDLIASKNLLEELSGREIQGFRMARMQQVDESEILKAGYRYHSSLNPTWIPGRYDHRDKSKRPFFELDLWNVPASVSPNFRIPLFWLAFKNFPLFLYRYLAARALRGNGYLNLYFHPWEFSDLGRYALPSHVKRGHGGPLLAKLESLLKGWKRDGTGEFVTMQRYVNNLSDGIK
jgi:hypothetical protein